ncbi:putative metabolite transport protein NicT [Tetrabaena socialis]|uniref:Putative metabolite transport protein NicT n=1 Tax=Tetrabaena socialis TaxID=47790 RepID=A0A2J8AC51_9CHLO|nr:putative metabolite transport protein NicT [Tetrabaena socialis]|eukprot:PNH10102.1 putative metabolite transport protein NicT [Tetrabaena socialis]
MAYLPLSSRDAAEDARSGHHPGLMSAVAPAGRRAVAHRHGTVTGLQAGTDVDGEGFGADAAALGAGEGSGTAAAAGDDSDDGGSTVDGGVDMQRLFQKVGARLLPLFFTMVICCYVDRTSLAFAAIQMNADLKFPPAVYGMGSGLFFIGYSFFQIPSNLLLRHFGGPAWLAIIIAAWGATAAAFAGMTTASHFYALRLLLGLTEAGAFPGMWYCLSLFFPGDQVRRGRGGGPTRMKLAMYRLLPRSPETAAFLTPAERRALLRRIEQHARSTNPGGAGGSPKRLKAGSVGGGGGSTASGSNWVAFRLAVTNKYVWYMGAVKFVRDIASFGIIFWTPTIVNALILEMRQTPGAAASGAGAGRGLRSDMMPPGGHGPGSAGVSAVLLTALPFALAAIGGMCLAHSAQRVGERFIHVAVPYMVTGVALTTYSAAADRSPWLGFMVLSLGVVGVYCGSGPCLSMLSELAAGPGLVVALPMYNSLGTMGGFVGPALVGFMVQRAQGTAARAASLDAKSAAAVIHGGGFGVSAVLLGSALCLAGVMVLCLGAHLGKLRPGLDLIVASVRGAGGPAGAAGGQTGTKSAPQNWLDHRTGWPGYGGARYCGVP